MVLAIGLSSACRSKTPFACCSGTPSPPFDRSSMRVLRGGTLVLGVGATGALSSSDHSDIAHSTSKWSDHRQARCRPTYGERHPPSSSSSGPVHLPLPSSPGLSPTPGEDSPSDQHSCLETLMRH